jgi:hypothetical protein
MQPAGTGILNQLTPRLVSLVERSSRQRLATWRMRSIVGTAAIALLAQRRDGSRFIDRSLVTPLYLFQAVHGLHGAGRAK